MDTYRDFDFHQTLFRTHHLTNDIVKIKYYKTCNNTITQHNYFKAQFVKETPFENNVEIIWSFERQNKE